MENEQKIVVIIDWSNLKRGQRDQSYKIGEYSKEAGFKKIIEDLSKIGTINRAYIIAPEHDLHGHAQFLSEKGFNIILAPLEEIVLENGTITLEDTTDAKLIDNALDLIANYDMQYLCLGSGDHGFRGILEAAKAKGIKIIIVYGSEKSLSKEIREMADPYPEGHPKKGQPMLHLFDPRKENRNHRNNLLAVI